MRNVSARLLILPFLFPFLSSVSDHDLKARAVVVPATNP